MLTALFEEGLIQDLFTVGHHFHVADVFLHHRDIGAEVKSHLLACGLSLDELSPTQVQRLQQLRRENPTLCVGNLASLVLSEAHTCPILAGNTGLGTMPAVVERGLLDLNWIMEELEPVVPLDRLHQSFEAIVANERYHYHLHSPEVAARLQRYAANVNAPS